jgi:lysophospholipase L1-like esterase
MQFIRKCASGARLRVGYIGGSITAGAFAGIGKKKYSSQLTQFLGKSFPQSSFTEINAGIGATPSRFGCSRAYEDLIVYSPDIIVIDFTVNDTCDEQGITQLSMEGLIRRCLRYRSDVPVIMAQMMEILGKTDVHTVHRKIAAYYGIPVISLHHALFYYIDNSLLQWIDIITDNVHPNDNGHTIIAYLLYSFIKRIAARYQTIHALSPSPELPHPLFSDMYETAEIFRYQDQHISIEKSTNWETYYDNENHTVLKSEDNQGEVQISGTVSEITIGCLSSRDFNEHLEISIDGTVTDTICNRNETTLDGIFLSFHRIFVNEQPEPVSVNLRTIDSNPSHDFTVRYLLYAY